MDKKNGNGNGNGIPTSNRLDMEDILNVRKAIEVKKSLNEIQEKIKEVMDRLEATKGLTSSANGSNMMLNMMNKVGCSMDMLKKCSLLKVLKICEDVNKKLEHTMKLTSTVEQDVVNTVSKVETYYVESRVDSMTEMYNRRSFDTALKIYSEEDYLFTLVFMDLNSLKPINDTFGHTAGDEVLKEFSRTVLLIFGTEKCYSYRIGGDEFAIISFDDSEKIVSKINSLKRNLNNRTFSFGRGENRQNINVDFAVGHMTRQCGDDADSLLHKVDKLMYTDKKSSKSRNTNGVGYLPETDAEKACSETSVHSQ